MTTLSSKFKYIQKSTLSSQYYSSPSLNNYCNNSSQDTPNPFPQKLATSTGAAGGVMTAYQDRHSGASSTEAGVSAVMADGRVPSTSLWINWCM